jgi:hypothetical protein
VKVASASLAAERGTGDGPEQPAIRRLNINQKTLCMEEEYLGSKMREAANQLVDAVAGAKVQALSGSG